MKRTLKITTKKNKTLFSLLIISLFLVKCNNTNSDSPSLKGGKIQEIEKHNSSSSLTPIEEGQKIAMQTKGVLGKNLMEAINSKGTVGAVTFCSTRAIPLTDSVAVSLNAKIKRVSDNNRNPSNKANNTEIKYLNEMKLAISQGKNPEPYLTSANGKNLGYYPITTNQMCLQCHGQPKTEISPKTLLELNSLYPHDKAVGYKVNELRGMWVVEMNSK